MWIKKYLERRRYRRINPSEKKVQAFLDRQAKESKIFAEFMSAAVNRKFPIVIHVEVDGVGCSAGVILPGGRLPEFLANWACSQMLIKQDAADRYRQGHRGGVFSGE